MTRSLAFLDRRPIIIAIAGSNGAGKSTFYDAFLADSGLRFVNADAIAGALGMAPYEAAEVAAATREALVNQRESFIFETVLSDPVGAKVDQLRSHASLGYTIALVFMELDSVEESIRRVSMRVSQGGHDVPDEKLRGRFDRTRANLRRAIERLPHVVVYNNSDLSRPYRLVAVYDRGTQRAL